MESSAEKLPQRCNRLLGALLRACPGLDQALVHCSEAPGTQLYQEGDVIEDVYFPTHGVVSIVVRLLDGGTAEVQTIGNEGMVGLSSWLDIPTSPDTALQQAPGELVRIAVDTFRRAAERSERARRLLGGYAGYSMRFSNQTCVCNARHTIPQRLCRWLLTSADRDGSDELKMSQAMLAEMLGVRRQSVSEILGALRKRGVVEPRRGGIYILDRARLQVAACECYRTTKAAYARLVEPLL
jgi:CRP-like cAMP-binding protein